MDVLTTPSKLFRELRLQESTPIVVTEPESIKNFNGQLTGAPLDDWKTWLRWRDLKIAAPYLGKPIAAEDFRFERTTLAGVPEQLPRWQTCANVVDSNLADALGQAWVEKYFPPQVRRRVNELVDNLRATMRENLEHSEWMQPETKKAALLKLDALRVDVGYPNRWRDYSTVKMSRGEYFNNIRSAWIYDYEHKLAKIGKPVDLDEWFSTTPPTVNAFSNPRRVLLIFPAGILQPPFFDGQADDAANYGSIGAVIGHEIGHQFDDGGSKFDASGALRNWWTVKDLVSYRARTACVVDQFNSLDIGEGRHHNGKLVLGEALGDLTGLFIAYQAYQRSLGGKPGPVIDGFTANQRFFIAFAQSWENQSRPEAELLQLNTDPHPLERYRVIATLQNMPEFHRAFRCKLGDLMVRPAGEQCKLW